MKYKPLLPLFIFVAAITACKTEHENKVAIRDFRKSLQPYLAELASKGCVYSSNATQYIKVNASLEELKQLSQSENPIFRAFAFRAMLERPGIDHFQLIMTNLDDSAIVATDDAVGREGGASRDQLQIEFSRVSEYLLTHGKWKDSNARLETINEVILNHNYLRSAYEKLLEIPAEEKYYPYIRKMLERECGEDVVFRLLTDKDYECAIYGIAKFKKAEDLPLIREALSDAWLSDISFRLMQEFPNDSYMEILENFYRRQFYNDYRRYRRDINWYSSTASFLRAIASYKNERSATILDSILNKEPVMPGVLNSETIHWIKLELVGAILDNDCDAYSKLRSQLAAKYPRMVEEYKLNLNERITIRPGNSSEPISWR